MIETKKEEIRKNKGWDNLIPVKKGEIRNPKGRPPMTKQEKQVKKATKQLIEDYKRTLAEALPKISPALIEQAILGNIIAIKEVNDRVMGKPKESIDLTTGGESFKTTPEEREAINRVFKLDEKVNI